MIIIYKKLHPQDSTWDEMGDGVGYNMARPEGREQIQPHECTEPSQDNFSGVITDFFGFDPTHTTTSLIPDIQNVSLYYVLHRPSQRYRQMMTSSNNGEAIVNISPKIVCRLPVPGRGCAVLVAGNDNFIFIYVSFRLLWTCHIYVNLFSM